MKEAHSFAEVNLQNCFWKKGKYELFYNSMFFCAGFLISTFSGRFSISTFQAAFHFQLFSGWFSISTFLRRVFNFNFSSGRFSIETFSGRFSIGHNGVWEGALDHSAHLAAAEKRPNRLF